MAGDSFLDALSAVRREAPADDPFLSALSDVRADAAPKPSLLQRAIPAAMRIVPTVAGGFLGSAFGPGEPRPVARLGPRSVSTRGRCTNN
jgi:hypothetical protein